MNKYEILSGTITGIIVGIVLFIINSINLYLQKKHEEEKEDFIKIQKNIELNEICNESQYNDLKVATLDYIVKLYYNESLANSDIQFNYDKIECGEIKNISTYFTGIKILKSEDSYSCIVKKIDNSESLLDYSSVSFKHIHYPEKDYYLIDINQIMKTDANIEKKIIEFEKKIDLLAKQIYSKKFKKKIKIIKHVISYISDSNNNSIPWYSNEEILEYNIKSEKKLDKNQNWVNFSSEGLPYILFSSNSIPIAMESATSICTELIMNSEQSEFKGCNTLGLKKDEINNIISTYIESIDRNEFDTYNNMVLTNAASLSEIDNWQEFSLIHSKISSYASLYILRDRRIKNIYYNVKMKIEKVFNKISKY